MAVRMLSTIILSFFLIYATGGTAAEPPKTITGKDGAEMVFIPGGSFLMGTDDEMLSETAAEHKVEVDGFYMDRKEVTNGQFAKFLNSVRLPEDINGPRWQWLVLRSDLNYEERASWWPTEIIYEKNQYRAFPGFEDYPVITVSWYAASEYCRWAGKRLPTEAEWEKAARGGLKKMQYPWGDAIPTEGIIFNRKWRDNEAPPPTSPVGNYHPNGYGLFDMAGNVWEWCSDWYHPFYYNVSDKNNPAGPETGIYKILRGGSWFNNHMVLKVAIRNFSEPDALNETVGFRCAMDSAEEEEEE